MSVLSRLAPSGRAHGAQRMFSMTILVLEAFVMFFAVLASHQLVADERVLSWSWGLGTAVVLLLAAGMLRRGAWAYVIGFAAQVPMILFGLQVSAMWVVGAGFAILFAYGVRKGHQLDREKDAVDRRVRAERGEAGDEPTA